MSSHQKRMMVWSDFRIGKPELDPEIIRLVENISQACEDALWELFRSNGVIRAGQTRQEALEAAKTFCETLGLIPKVSYTPDLYDRTSLNVVAEFRAVKIAPKDVPEVPCEQCGGSKVDIGYDDMGTPIESPCQKCKA